MRKLAFLLMLLFGINLNAQISAPQAAASKPEAYSLFNQPLYPISFSKEEQARLDSNLARAQQELAAHPNDPDRVIWVGRRLGYLWRYQEAVAVLSQGIAQHPNEAKLYRHRGHRYISLREFDQAIADLEKASALIQGVADEIEPDGAPNKHNIPTSTSHSNIWYHLGLAYYLKGDFDNARRCYVECMKFSRGNDDMLCATSDWLYMTYRRLGREQEARKVLEAIQPEMKILENQSYHKRLLMYKGLMPPDSLLEVKQSAELDVATQGYGVGNWNFYNGEKEKAREIFQRVLKGRHWAAFGYIAAEAELKKWR